MDYKNLLLKSNAEKLIPHQNLINYKLKITAISLISLVRYKITNKKFPFCFPNFFGEFCTQIISHTTGINKINSGTRQLLRNSKKIALLFLYHYFFSNRIGSTDYYFVINTRSL